MRVRPGRLTPITTIRYTSGGGNPLARHVRGPRPRHVAPPLAAPRRDASDPPTLPGSSRRVLVGGVGYRNLRDMSAGPELIDRLRAQRGRRGAE